MDPDRLSTSPPDVASPPSYATHRSSDADRRSSSTTYTGAHHHHLHHHPSLPSIHQLHPDLPSAGPPSSTHRIATMVPPTAYSSGYEHSSSGYAHRPAEDMSEQEGDTSGPPKKKRRRQALSCTECKRRKIKCDRAQPCGPCSRRGEQSKCQWHIIEPMEKYVTRAEYDDLKHRFDHLESTLARILPSYSGAPHPNTMSPTMSIASSSAAESTPQAAAAAMHPYRVPTGPGSPAYRMPSPQPSARGEPPFPASASAAAAAAPRSPQVHYRMPPAAYSQARPPRAAMPSPPTSASRPPPSPSPPPLSSSSRLPETRAPPTSRRASLSLAAITSPYLPEPSPYAQPKNHRAQTLPSLGQRLRKASAHTGPAAEPLRTPHILHSNISSSSSRAHHTIRIDILPAGMVTSKWKPPSRLPNTRRRSLRPRRRPLRAMSRTLLYPPQQQDPQQQQHHQLHFRFDHSKVAIPANHSATLVANSRRFIL